jgi:predicted cupin superfamily sugar epimerase
MHTRARELIAELGLAPHPEGGFFREIHRSALRVQPQDDRPMRAALTTIYYLLAGDAHSRWHRVRSDEVWHLYEGGPLELRIADPQLSRVAVLRLQTASAAGGPVGIVPADHWQAARPCGDYALVGCTVGPGFEFDDFEFLRSSVLGSRLSDPVDIALI